MATHLFEHRVERPRSRTAWMASLGVHACLMVAVAYLSWTTLGRGSFRRQTEAPTMIVGLSDGAAVDAEEADADLETADEASGDAEDVSARPEDLGDDDATRVVAPTEDATALLAPPPRLPLLSLGAPSATRASPASAAAAPARTQQFRRFVEQATVTVFGARGEGTRFVYVFDRSTSMEGAPLTAAKQQLIGSLDALSSVHQFQVIFFNNEMQAWDLTGGQRRVPFASDANKRLAADFVRGVFAAGGTERRRPLIAALNLRPDVIFFLTDCDDAMGDHDVNDIVERAESQGTKIACIEYGFGPSKQHTNFLWEIASRTRADYVYVDATQLGAK